MITLAIDTSTTRGSVALLADGILRLEENFLADRSHSATLFAVLERALALVSGRSVSIRLLSVLARARMRECGMLVAAAIRLRNWAGLAARQVSRPWPHWRRTSRIFWRSETRGRKPFTSRASKMARASKARCSRHGIRTSREGLPLMP